MSYLRRDHELFWILEVLFLTPVAIFWSGVIASYFGSNTLLISAIGSPMSPLKGLVVAVACPLAAAWVAKDYVLQNKREKSATLDVARAIIAVSLITVTLVLAYIIATNYKA